MKGKRSVEHSSTPPAPKAPTRSPKPRLPWWQRERVIRLEQEAPNALAEEHRDATHKMEAQQEHSGSWHSKGWHKTQSLSKSLNSKKSLSFSLSLSLRWHS